MRHEINMKKLYGTALASLGQLEDGGGSGEVPIAMTHSLKRRVHDWERIDDDPSSPLGEVMMKKMHNSDTLMLIYVVCDARAVVEWAERRMWIKETI